MHEERVQFDGVPARLYQPAAASELLLFGHGGEQSKDSPRFVSLCRSYAEGTGLAVVCMDAVAHGERSSVDASPSLPQRWHSSTAAQMVNDWQRCADGFRSIGPPVAYVGFSMGMIFGAPTVASLPSFRAAVFGVGGIPGGSWIDDAPLEDLLLGAAAKLGDVQLLMVNVTNDELFTTDGTHRFFRAVPGRQKRLMFWEGGHDDWPVEAHEHSIRFVIDHTSAQL
jgi:dienelactone hydrolase